MAKEKQLPRAIQSFVLNGGSDGLVTVASTKKFKVKASVLITATSLPTLTLEIKEVINSTQMIVGMAGNIKLTSDVSLYTVALNAQIEQPKQPRPQVHIDDQNMATYEQEPTLARRSVLVDEFGNFYDTDNPFKVQLSDGSINIGSVNAELEVQLSRKDNWPNAGDVHDSVRIGNQDGEVTFSPDGNTNKYGMDVTVLNRPIDVNFKKITIAAKNEDGDPLIIHVKNQLGVIVRTLNLSYDEDGDFLELEKN